MIATKVVEEYHTAFYCHIGARIIIKVAEDKMNNFEYTYAFLDELNDTCMNTWTLIDQIWNTNDINGESESYSGDKMMMTILPITIMLKIIFSVKLLSTITMMSMNRHERLTLDETDDGVVLKGRRHFIAKQIIIICILWPT